MTQSESDCRRMLENQGEPNELYLFFEWVVPPTPNEKVTFRRSTEKNMGEGTLRIL